MGGSSGGIPNLSGGFFPSTPQFNPSALSSMVWNMGNVQPGPYGPQPQPMQGPGIFSPPAPQQAASPSPLLGAMQPKWGGLYDLSGNKTYGAGYLSGNRGGSR